MDDEKQKKVKKNEKTKKKQTKTKTALKKKTKEYPKNQKKDIGELIPGDLDLHKKFPNYQFREELRPKVFNNLIRERACESFVSVLDSYGEEKEANGEDDIQLTWTPAQLKEFDEQTYKAVNGRLFKYNTVILRKVVGGNNKFIDWHTDVTASKTMQIFLNDHTEYEGGDTAYVLKDGFVSIPRRIVGRAIVHDSNVMHGVTKIVKGNRYSLFFLLKN